MVLVFIAVLAMPRCSTSAFQIGDGASELPRRRLSGDSGVVANRYKTEAAAAVVDAETVAKGLTWT